MKQGLDLKTAHRAEQIRRVEASPAFQKMLQRREQKLAAMQDATHAALPGPLADAFNGQPLTLGHLVLHEMTAAHRVLLEKIDSPFLRQIRAAAKADPSDRSDPSAPAPETAYHDEEVYETLFVLTREPRESREALALGRPKFRDLALQATADQLPLCDESAVVNVVTAAFLRAFSTFVEVQSTEAGEGGADPLAARQPMASAGSSTSSPTAPAATRKNSPDSGKRHRSAASSPSTPGNGSTARGVA